jgi:hypothetical protein
MDPKRKLPDADPSAFEGGDPPCWAHLFDDTPDDAPTAETAPPAATDQEGAPDDVGTAPPAGRASGSTAPAPAERPAAP